MEIAGLMDDLTDETVSDRWCSGCLTRADHKRVNQRAESVKVATFVCSNCGAATTPCIVLGCENFALRGSRNVNVPRYCAEHRHDIPSFVSGLSCSRLRSRRTPGRWRRPGPA